MVVTIALAVSLLEAFWMLPTHVVALKVRFDDPSRLHRWRTRFTHRLQIGYVRLLLQVLRRPRLSLAGMVLLFLAAAGAVGAGLVRMDFFASDTLRLFYVNVEMPPATPVEDTLEKVLEVERKVRSHIRPGEMRAMVSYAGNTFTEMEPRLGDQYGQILVGLNPKTPELRDVEEMIEAMRADLTATPGPTHVSFLRLAGGPPTSKPVSVKVRGDDYTRLRAAADALKDMLRSIEGTKDIEDDAARGRSELVLALDNDALKRAGLDPREVNRSLQLLVDGQVVAELSDQGEKVEVRVRAQPRALQDIVGLLDFRLPLPSRRRGRAAGARHGAARRQPREPPPLQLPPHDHGRGGPGQGTHRHGGRQREAARRVAERIAARYPDIDLDFSGELDDIQESLDAIGVLFLLGVGVMYLILGAQFRSYWQPFMILATVPDGLHRAWRWGWSRPAIR